MDSFGWIDLKLYGFRYPYKKSRKPLNRECEGAKRYFRSEKWLGLRTKRLQHSLKFLYTFSACRGYKSHCKNFNEYYECFVPGTRHFTEQWYPWAPRSPDLAGFFSCGYLKPKVFEANPSRIMQAVGTTHLEYD